MDLLMEAREQNKCLRLQVLTLRQKLEDSGTDVRTLHKATTQSCIRQEGSECTPAVHQREEMIEQLERLNVKVMLCKC